MRVVTLKVDEGLLRRMDEAARVLGWSRSELIRRAVAKYLREHVPETPHTDNTIQYRVVHVW